MSEKGEEKAGDSAASAVAFGCEGILKRNQVGKRVRVEEESEEEEKLRGRSIDCEGSTWREEREERRGDQCITDCSCCLLSTASAAADASSLHRGREREERNTSVLMLQLQRQLHSCCQFQDPTGPVKPFTEPVGTGQGPDIYIHYLYIIQKV